MEEVKFIVEETFTGFSAYAENLPVYTTGKSMAELKANIDEAMNLYREETGVGEGTNIVVSPRPIV